MVQLSAGARSALIGVGAGVAATALIAGIVFAVQSRGAVEPQETAAPSVSVAPSPTAAPDLEVLSAAVQGALDDGIGPNEYPPMAKPISEGYPLARKMEPWVWDKVGPLWSVVAYSDSEYGYSEYDDAAPTGVYLMSPEGVFFELAEIPGSELTVQGVLTWREDRREAVLDGGSKYVVNLETGRVKPVVIFDGSEPADYTEFLGASSDGAELWLGRFWDDDRDEDVFYRWTSAGGFERVLEGERDVFAPYSYELATPDFEAIILGVHDVGDSTFTSSRSGPVGQPRFLRYDLDTGETTLIAPDYPARRLPCNRDYYDFSWNSDGKIVLWCDDGAVAVDPETGRAAAAEDSDWGYQPADLRFPGVSLEKIPGKKNKPWLDFGYRSLTYENGDKSVTIKFPVDDRGYGEDVWRIVEIAPGAIAIDTWHSYYVIDAVTGEYVEWFPRGTRRDGRTIWPSHAAYGAPSGAESQECGC